MTIIGPPGTDALGEAGGRISNKSVEVMNRLLNSVTCIMELVTAPSPSCELLKCDRASHLERRPAVRAGYRTMSGAVATPEVEPEKRRGRERPGRFAHKPTKPEAQFHRPRNKTHSCDISTSKRRGSA